MLKFSIGFLAAVQAIRLETQRGGVDPEHISRKGVNQDDDDQEQQKCKAAIVNCKTNTPPVIMDQKAQAQESEHAKNEEKLFQAMEDAQNAAKTEFNKAEAEYEKCIVAPYELCPSAGVFAAANQAVYEVVSSDEYKKKTAECNGLGWIRYTAHSAYSVAYWSDLYFSDYNAWNIAQNKAFDKYSDAFGHEQSCLTEKNEIDDYGKKKLIEAEAEAAAQLEREPHVEMLLAARDAKKAAMKEAESTYDKNTKNNDQAHDQWMKQHAMLQCEQKVKLACGQ